MSRNNPYKNPHNVSLFLQGQLQKSFSFPATDPRFVKYHDIIGIAVEQAKKQTTSPMGGQPIEWDEIAVSYFGCVIRESHPSN